MGPTYAKLVARIVIKIELEITSQLLRSIHHACINRCRESRQANGIDTVEPMDLRLELTRCVVIVSWGSPLLVLLEVGLHTLPRPPWVTTDLGDAIVVL